MPPPVSDDDSMSGADDQVPARPQKKARKEDTVEDDDEGSEEEEADEYVVEKLLAHDYLDTGELRYQVKWKGYEAKDDLTWEPLENLEDAQEVLQAYHDKIGEVPPPTKPKASAKKGKKGKRSASAAFDNESPAPSKEGKSVANGKPEPERESVKLPEGSWESDVLRVSSILQEEYPIEQRPKGRAGKQSTTDLTGLLEWNNGKRSQHPLKTLRTKCPQKLLDYYEQHLKFESISNDETDI